MTSLQDITRGLNNVTTYGQGKIAVGEALTALGTAYTKGGLSQHNINALNLARLPLEALYHNIAPLPDSGKFVNWDVSKQLVLRAYVEVAGVGGQLDARKTISITSIIGESIVEAPKVFGTAVGKVTREIGEAAGGVVGGVFSGLGPVMVLVIAVLIAATVYGKARA